MAPDALDALARLLPHLGVGLALDVQVDVATVALAAAHADVPGANLLAKALEKALEVDEELLFGNDERVRLAHVRGSLDGRSGRDGAEKAGRRREGRRSGEALRDEQVELRVARALKVRRQRRGLVDDAGGR